MITQESPRRPSEAEIEEAHRILQEASFYDKTDHLRALAEIQERGKQPIPTFRPSGFKNIHDVQAFDEGLIKVDTESLAKAIGGEVAHVKDKRFLQAAGHRFERGPTGYFYDDTGATFTPVRMIGKVLGIEGPALYMAMDQNLDLCALVETAPVEWTLVELTDGRSSAATDHEAAFRKLDLKPDDAGKFFRSKFSRLLVEDEVWNLAEDHIWTRFFISTAGKLVLGTPKSIDLSEVLDA